jgi:hypothetical protein
MERIKANEISQPLATLKRKREFLLFVFCFVQFLAGAQNDSIPQRTRYSGHMMLSGGYAKPLEDIASSSTIGSAKNGLGLQFLIQIPLLKRFGLCVAYDYGVFYVDQDELDERNISFSYPLISGVTSSVSVHQNWVMSTLNVGAYASLPLSQNQNVNLETRVMFGSSIATSPGVSCTYATFSPTTMAVSYKTETLFSSKSGNFPLTFLFGIGLRFDLNSDWCLGVNFDYLNVVNETEFDEIEIKNTQNKTSVFSKEFDLGYYAFKFGIGRFF